MNPQPALEEATAAKESHPLGTVVSRISHTVCADSFPTGERAALRRMTPGQALPLAFYGFAESQLQEGWIQQKDDWVALVAGIAIMSPRSHDPNAQLGKALAAAGYSELRLERLLHARSTTARTLLLRAARLLAAKQSACNWLDCAQLLLTRDAGRREEVRMRIARSFYREQHAQGQHTKKEES